MPSQESCQTALLIALCLLGVVLIVCACSHFSKEGYEIPLMYQGNYAVLQGKNDMFGYQGENQGQWGYTRYWSEREVGEDVLNNPDDRTTYDKENDKAFQEAEVYNAGNNTIQLELSGKTNSGGSYTTDVMYPQWLSGNGNLRCKPTGECVILTSSTANTPVKAAWSMIRDQQRNLEERMRLGYIKQELANLKLY
jgi:hypothetical protein